MTHGPSCAGISWTNPGSEQVHCYKVSAVVAFEHLRVEGRDDILGIGLCCSSIGIGGFDQILIGPVFGEGAESIKHEE